MANPTAEEKALFLEYIRSGDDRATAAFRVNPEYTGTLFRSLCNPRSPRHYDAKFAEAYDKALEERGPLDPDREQIGPGEIEPRTKTANGFTKATHLTREQLDHFLELVRDGMRAASAVEKIDPPTSMTQISRRAAKDADFAEAFRLAKEEGYEAYRENLRAEATRQAFAGDYRALKDQMLMHLPEAQVLTTNRHEISGIDGGAIRLFAEQNFADLPPELLEQMISLLEEKEFGQKQLPPGGGDGKQR